MSHEERNTVSALLTSFIILGYFVSLIWGTWNAGGYDGPDGLQIWARTILRMVPACIVLTIIVTIGFNILHAIATNTPRPSFVVDERDQQIGRRGLQVTMIVASFGFIASLIGLAFGWSAIAALNLIAASFAVGDIAGNLSKMLAYRLGV